MKRVALALLVACRAPAPTTLPRIAPIAPSLPPRPCLRPPPAEPPMTGDESIDRHRRDWHRQRLIAWAALAYETCR